MEELKKYHKQYKECAIVFLKKYPRIIVQEREDECTSDLEDKIDHAYNRYKKKTTEGKREMMIDVASGLIIPIFSGIAGCVAIVCHFPVICMITPTCYLFGWGIQKYLAHNNKEKEKYD